MSASSKALTASGVVLGGSAAVAGGTFLALQESTTTIGEELDLYLIKDSKDFKVRFEEKGEGFLPEIKDAKTLENWCKDQYKKEFTSQLKEEENGIWKQVRKICTFTIKQKLSDKHLSVVGAGDNNKDKNDWSVKEQKLREYGYFSVVSSLSLTTDFENIRKSIKSEQSSTNSWEPIKNWCSQQYSKNLLEDTLDVFEIAKKFCTKVFIEDILDGSELPVSSEFNDDWTVLVERAKNTSSDQGMKDTEFKKKLSDPNANQKLQLWCKNQYKKHFLKKEPWDSSSSNPVLVLDEVFKWCSVKIVNKLPSEKIFGLQQENPTDTRWTELSSLLDSHRDEEQIKLTEELREIKKSTDSNEKITKLKNWCFSAYATGYKGTKDNIWLLVNKFCTK